MEAPRCGTCRHWQPLLRPRQVTDTQPGNCLVIEPHPFWLHPFAALTLAGEGIYCAAWSKKHAHASPAATR